MARGCSKANPVTEVVLGDRSGPGRDGRESGMYVYLVAEFITPKHVHFQFYGGWSYLKKCKVYSLSYPKLPP